jgi:hypothetical protein
MPRKQQISLARYALLSLRRSLFRRTFLGGKDKLSAQKLKRR